MEPVEDILCSNCKGPDHVGWGLGAATGWPLLVLCLLSQLVSLEWQLQAKASPVINVFSFEMGSHCASPHQPCIPGPKLPEEMGPQAASDLLLNYPYSVLTNSP